jgi:probable F420-dependent oxidoreductase
MPGLNRAPAQWRDELRRIEDLGFNTACISDHFTGGWAMDPIVAMTVAAEATTRLRVQSMVLCNDFRHPVLLHKSMANLDVFSGGRLELGLGAGWLRDDHDAAGLAFDPPSVRLARLEEAIEVITALFGGGPVTYHGKHYQVTALDGLPKPAQRPRPPLLVGGGGPKVLALAGRTADIVGINARLSPDSDPGAALDDLSPDQVARKVSWITKAAIETGRDPGAIELMLSILDLSIDGQRSVSSLARHASAEALAASPAVLHGSVAECADKLVEVRERYGISYLHLGSNVDAAAPLVASLAGT